ncbi:conserved Plasmodium protein, unknown function [Plasmodium vivax]|uniref:Uncharacterized protein n=1 Tax=Plasmodium vivax TaxID=5855 RepID=A0A1G4GS80_PLAVI|nr:conserved Plasmodium protein, unknown function [Plasmodium vivax]
MPIYYLYDEEDFAKANYDISKVRIRSDADSFEGGDDQMVEEEEEDEEVQGEGEGGDAVDAGDGETTEGRRGDEEERSKQEASPNLAETPSPAAFAAYGEGEEHGGEGRHSQHGKHGNHGDHGNHGKHEKHSKHGKNKKHRKHGKHGKHRRHSKHAAPNGAEPQEEAPRDVPLLEDKAYAKFMKRKKEKKIFVVLEMPHNINSSAYQDVKVNGRERESYYIVYSSMGHGGEPYVEGDAHRKHERRERCEQQDQQDLHSHHNLQQPTGHSENPGQDAEAERRGPPNSIATDEETEKKENLKLKLKLKQVNFANSNGRSNVDGEVAQGCGSPPWEDAEGGNDPTGEVPHEKGKTKRKAEAEGEEDHRYADDNHKSKHIPNILDLVSLNKYTEENHLKGSNYMFIVIEDDIWNKEKEKNCNNWKNFCQGETVTVKRKGEYHIKILIEISLTFSLFNLSSSRNNLYFNRSENLLVGLQNYACNSTWFPTLSKMGNIYGRCSWGLLFKIEKPYVVISSNSLINVYDVGNVNFFLYKTSSRHGKLAPHQISLYAGRFDFLHLNNLNFKDFHQINYDFLYKTEVGLRSNKSYSVDQYGKAKGKGGGGAFGRTDRLAEGAVPPSRENLSSGGKPKRRSSTRRYYVDSEGSSEGAMGANNAMGVNKAIGANNAMGVNKAIGANGANSVTNADAANNTDAANNAGAANNPDGVNSNGATAATAPDQGGAPPTSEYREKGVPKKEWRSYYERVKDKVVPNIFIFTVKNYKDEMVHSSYHVGYVLRAFLEMSKESFPFDNITILFLPLSFLNLEHYPSSESIESSISAHIYDDMKNGYSLFANSNLLNAKLSEPYVFLGNNKYFIFGNVIVFSTQILHSLYDTLFNICLYSYKIVMAEGLLSLCFDHYADVVKDESVHLVLMLKCLVLQKYLEQIFGTIEMNVIFYELRERYCSLVELFGDVNLFYHCGKERGKSFTSTQVRKMPAGMVSPHSNVPPTGESFPTHGRSPYALNSLFFLKAFLCVRIFFNILKSFSFCATIQQYCFGLFFSYLKRKGRVISSSKFWKQVLAECTRRYIESYKQLPKNKFKMKRIDLHANSSELRSDEHEQYQLLEKYFSQFLQTYIKGYGVCQYILTFNVHLQRKGTSMDSFNFLVSQNSINPFNFVNENFHSDYFLAEMASTSVYNLLELNKHIDWKSSTHGGKHNSRRNKMIMQNYLDRIYYDKLSEKGSPSDYFHHNLEKQFLSFLKEKKNLQIDHFYEYREDLLSRKANELLKRHVMRRKRKSFAFLPRATLRKMALPGQIGTTQSSKDTIGRNPVGYVPKREEQALGEGAGATPLQSENESNWLVAKRHTEGATEGDTCKDQTGGALYGGTADGEVPLIDEPLAQRDVSKKRKSKKRKRHEKGKKKKKKKKKSNREQTTVDDLIRAEKINRRLKISRNYFLKKKKEIINLPYSNYDSLELIARDGNFYLGFGYVGSDDLALTTGKGNLHNNIIAYQKFKNCNLKKLSELCVDKHHIHEYNSTTPFHTSCIYPQWKTTLRLFYYLHLLSKIQKKKKLLMRATAPVLDAKEENEIDIFGQGDHVGGKLLADKLHADKQGRKKQKKERKKKEKKKDTHGGSRHDEARHRHRKAKRRKKMHKMGGIQMVENLEGAQNVESVENVENMGSMNQAEGATGVPSGGVNADEEEALRGGYGGDVDGFNHPPYGTLESTTSLNFDYLYAGGMLEGGVTAPPFDSIANEGVSVGKAQGGHADGINDVADDAAVDVTVDGEADPAASHAGDPPGGGESKKEKKKKREKRKMKKSKEKIKSLRDLLLNNKLYAENYLNPYVANNMPISVDENKFFFCLLKIEIVEDDGVRVVKKNLLDNVTPTRFSVNARPEKGRKKVAFKHEAIYMSKHEEYVSRNPIDAMESYTNETVKFIGITNESDKHMIEYCKQKVLKKDKSLMCLDNRKLVAKICSKGKIPLLWIRIDNDFSILGRIRRTQSASMWIQQLFNDNSVFAQLESSFALAFIPFFFLQRNVAGGGAASAVVAVTGGVTAASGGVAGQVDYKTDQGTHPDGTLGINMHSHGVGASNSGTNPPHSTANGGENIGEDSMQFIQSVLSTNKSGKHKKNDFHLGTLPFNVASGATLDSQLLNDSYDVAHGQENPPHKNRMLEREVTSNSMANEKNVGAHHSSKGLMNNIVNADYASYAAGEEEEEEEEDAGLELPNLPSSGKYEKRRSSHLARIARNDEAPMKEKINANLVNEDQNDLLKMERLSSHSSSSGSETDVLDCNFSTSTIDDLNEDANASERNYSSSSYKKQKNYKKKWSRKISIANIPINVEVIKCLYKSITATYLHYMVKVRCVYSLCFIHNRYLCTQKIIQNLFLDYADEFYGNDLNQKRFMHAFYVAMSLLRNRNNRTPKIILFFFANKCANFVYSLNLSERYHLVSDAQGGVAAHSQGGIAASFQGAPPQGASPSGGMTNRMGKCPQKGEPPEELREDANASKLSCATSFPLIFPPSTNDLCKSYDSVSLKQGEAHRGSHSAVVNKDAPPEGAHDEVEMDFVVERMAALTQDQQEMCQEEGGILLPRRRTPHSYKTAQQKRTRKVTYERELLIQREEEEDIKMVLECLGNIRFKGEALPISGHLSGVPYGPTKDNPMSNKECLFSEYLSNATQSHPPHSAISHDNSFCKKNKKKNYHTYDFCNIHIYNHDEKKLKNNFLKLKKKKKEYVEELIDVLFLIYQLKKLSPFLPISDWVIIILIRTIGRNRSILDAFKRKMHWEYKDHFDFCRCLPSEVSPKGSGFNMSNFISARNANWFRLEIVRAIIHLILQGSIRLFQVFYRYTSEGEYSHDERGTQGCPPKWRPNSFASTPTKEKYLFVSNYTNYVERKTICSHVLNIYSAFQFCLQIAQLYEDAQFEMLLWSSLYSMLLICQQKHPFFFLPFSKMFSKYFKDYQKRSYSPFEFYFLLYGLSDVNAFEKGSLGGAAGYLGGAANYLRGANYLSGAAKGGPFSHPPDGCYSTDGRRSSDEHAANSLKQKSHPQLATSKGTKDAHIYKYSIVGYIKLITILKNVRHTNKLKKNFIQMSFIKYIVRCIHSILRSLIVSLASSNVNYFNNAILFELKNIMAFFFGYGIPPCCSSEWPRIYRPHYDQLRTIASKGVQINDLIKFLRTYYDNDKLFEWKIVASEFINVLKNMKELELFVDSPTVSLQKFNFVKENIWLTLIGAKLRNDIYKLPMDLKRDILLLLKNIRLVDMCLGTNHYEHVNNIFTVCWFIIVKIFQNYEKSK